MADSHSPPPLFTRSTWAQTLLLGLYLLSVGCSSSDSAAPAHATLSEVNLQVPIPEGWVINSSTPIKDPAKGGDILQLTPSSTVPGSPRVVVTILPLSTRAPSLQELAHQATLEMNSMRKTSRVTFTNRTRTSRQFAGQHAVEFDQSYTLGSGASTIAVSQFKILTVINNRGVSVTAGGRTELYTPFKEAITQLLKETQFLRAVETTP